MLCRLILFVLLFSFSSTYLLAQKDKKNDVQVIEFGDDDNNVSSDTRLGYIIKTNPFSYLFGWQFVELEKDISSFASVQGGIGLTFKSLLSGENYNEVLSEFSSVSACESTQWPNDYCDDIYDLSIREQKAGFVLASSVRLFFDDDAPDGSYFSITGRLSTKKYNVQQIVEGNSELVRLTDQFQTERERNFDIVGNYGYQMLYSNLTAEYFIGGGIRLTKQTRQDLGQDALGLYRSTEQQLKESIFRFEAGIRIGLQL